VAAILAQYTDMYEVVSRHGTAQRRARTCISSRPGAAYVRPRKRASCRPPVARRTTTNRYRAPPSMSATMTTAAGSDKQSWHASIILSSLARTHTHSPQLCHASLGRPSLKSLSPERHHLESTCARTRDSALSLGAYARSLLINN